MFPSSAVNYSIHYSYDCIKISLITIFLFHFVVLVLVHATNGRFFLRVKFLAYLFFFSFCNFIIFHISTSAVSGLKILAQRSTSEEMKVHSYLSNLSFFLSSLFQNSIEHVNCVVPFQAFSMETLFQRARKYQTDILQTLHI